jgi:hypothetical protein
MRSPLDFSREDRDREVVTRPTPSPASDISRERDFTPSIRDERLEEHHPGRTTYRERTLGRGYQLSQRELYTMAEIGRFRAIDTEDLSKYFYRGNQKLSHRDLDNLRAQRLVEVNVARYPETLKVATLTREGERLLRQEIESGHSQALYSGLAKVKELRHDAALYQVYQKKEAEISSQGGSVRRVILDYELKRDLYRDIAERLSKEAKARREGQGTPASMKQIKEEVAGQHGLKVVDSQIQIPDLRVEYEDANGEIDRVDLEYMTDSYRPGEIAAKARAGFSLYSSNDQTARFRKVLDRHRIIGEVLSL